jgi:predicted AlkP superfamily pyrophosphatase or phosphodiesterase
MRFRVTGLLFLAVLFSLGCQSATPAVRSTGKSSVRLAVLVVFDQMRGDYLERWKDAFGDKGFRELQTEGAWFTNCHYPYAWTSTGPGHASLLTGCSPDVHGIIENDWFDRSAGVRVYCASHDRYTRVPPLASEAPAEAAKAKEDGEGAPDRLLAPTLGEALKQETGGQGRVVSLSLKDRSAVLLAGRQPDACYWFDARSGTFATSSYYRDAVHSWVADYNRTRPADQWFGRPWERLRGDLDYERLSGPDDQVGEGKGYEQGVTFPHPFTGGLAKPGKNYYRAVLDSPFGNDLLFGLVKKAVEAEKLGQEDRTDLLCVSFSSNDVIGHIYGPDSQEMLDVTLRSDRIMADLLAYLNDKVGRDKYMLVMTSDHGVCPLIPVARKQGKDANILDPALQRGKPEEFLRSVYGKPGDEKTRWVASVGDYSFYLDHAVIRKAGHQVEEVAEKLARWLKEQPGVLTTYTAAQLRGQLSAEDQIGQRVQKAFHAERSGDVVLVPKPYHFFGALIGTNHGTPHPYDTHATLVVYGSHVHKGKRDDPVTPQASAAILAHGLGVKAPAKAEARVPEQMFHD